MHPCLTPPPSSTRGSSPDHHVDDPEARGRPSHNFTGLSLKTLQQGRPMTQTLRRTRDFSPTKSTKRHRSLSPSSSKTEDDDINAPASLPPIISYLSFVVKRAKAKRSNNPSSYRRRPRTLELRFAERYIGPSDMVPVDVERVCLLFM